MSGRHITLVTIPIEASKLIATLAREQPTIFRRVAPYLEAAFVQGLAADQLELIKLLNASLDTLVLPEQTVQQACLHWLKALAAMPAELGSAANPSPIFIESVTLH